MPYHRRRRVVEGHSKTIESNVTVKKQYRLTPHDDYHLSSSEQ